MTEYAPLVSQSRRKPAAWPPDLSAARGPGGIFRVQIDDVGRIFPSNRPNQRYPTLSIEKIVSILLDIVRPAQALIVTTAAVAGFAQRGSKWLHFRSLA
jgi:hypothetical protein